MNIWYPKSVYQMTPLLYFVFGIFILVMLDGLVANLIAIAIFGYVAYILWMRFMWKDSGHVN